MARAIAAEGLLKPPADALVIDTTHLTAEQTVEKIIDAC